MIFQTVGDSRPSPDHGRATRDWADIPPRAVRRERLTTTRSVLVLHARVLEIAG